MNTTYVINRADGGISILTVPEGADLNVEIGKWVDTADMAWLPITATQCDPDQLPKDRTWRDAWAIQDGKVEVSIVKAREVHKERLRAARAPRLAALDVQYMRALEEKDETAAASIAAVKQALRDITADPRIASAATVEQLTAVTLP